jgi:hypothetical protein
MTGIHHLGRSVGCGREFDSLSLPDFRSMPDPIAMPSRHFVALLAADATGVSVEVLREFSRKLLRAGCVYFCAWGADCERVHDIFDENCFEVEPVIMATWHSKESLDETLRFFVFCTYPDDGYAETCQSALVISIGSPELDKQIHTRLSDITFFNRDILDER